VTGKTLILIFAFLLIGRAHSQTTDDTVPWQVPQGWSYVLQVGPPEIYRHGTTTDLSGSATMEINTHLNAGILAKDVSLQNQADTTLKWQWRVDQLPSAVPEDSAETHDYISVAVLFDNGQDISYVWSSGLAEDTAFRCPLPDWNARETHLVIRSDPSELGQWLVEERNINADYERYIGGPMPGRIVQIWLIANTVFQGGTGTGHVADISIGRSSAEAPRKKVL
jgi:hypothetical protein